MAGTGRWLGGLLLGAAALALLAGGGFLVALVATGETTPAGAALGAFLLLLAIVAPLAAAGLHLTLSARREAGDEKALTEQRRLLEMVLAEGRVTFAEAAVLLGTPQSVVEEHVRRLVGLEVFSGAVDWKGGVLHSREAALLHADRACLGCGARLEIAGKGLVACGHCGAETFAIT